MHKYLIRFSKKGYIRFTSHLDMIRLFQRGMKRAGIGLAYSQGFHPHPRMSIVQPLSLGFTSEGEYVEIETDEPYEPEKLQERLGKVMPEGIDILMVKALPGGLKSPAALIEYGAYEIYFAMAHEQKDREIESDKDTASGRQAGLVALREKMEAFLSQKEILAEKRQKKTGQMVTTDIKPLIYKMNINDAGELVYNNCFMLTVMLRTGSTANLNPELLVRQFFAFTGIEPASGRLLLHRKDLFFMREGEPLSLSEIV